jgi:hypothetical protein
MTDDVGKIGWIDMTFEPSGLAGGRFCVIEDPGGSTAALYQP